MRSNHHHLPIDSSRKVVGKNETTSWKWRSFSVRESVVDEPTSPKIGCMGQIKKEKMPNSVAKAGGTNQKISKLKKMFSSKSFVRRTSKASSQGLMKNGNKIGGDLPVDLPLELDPPLPVKKLGKKKGFGDVPVSLWKRRSWIKLERLQLQNLKPRLINCPRGV